jgi:hypothetical protein
LNRAAWSRYERPVATGRPGWLEGWFKGWLNRRRVLGAVNPVATAIAADGSVYLGGLYAGSADFNPSTTGKDIRTTLDSDGFVTRFNPDGSYGWTATFEGRGTSQVTALAITPTGAVAVVGTYVDTIDLDPSATTNVRQTATPSQSDAFVVELTAAGALGWGGTFAGTLLDNERVAPGIAVDATGAVLVARTYAGTIDTDPGPGVTSHTAPNPGAMLVKLTPTGTLASARFYDNNGCTALLESVTVSSDGSIWAVGSADRGAGCSLDQSTNGPVGAILIVKHDAANTPIARWMMPTTQMGPRYSIAPGREGAVFIAGSGNQIDFDPGPRGPVTQYLTPDAIASAGNRFAVAGTSSGTVDMDPGPDLSLIYGDVAYVSRFTF